MIRISSTIMTRPVICSAVALATSFCLSLAIGASPAFAAKKIRYLSTARAQAFFPYPASVYPAPVPIDPLYAACGDMRITFPACPGH
jgi:hypothetical protein